MLLVVFILIVLIILCTLLTALLWVGHGTEIAGNHEMTMALRYASQFKYLALTFTGTLVIVTLTIINTFYEQVQV